MERNISLEMQSKIEKIAELAIGMKPSEWSCINIAIQKQYSSLSSKLRLENKEELVAAIEREF